MASSHVELIVSHPGSRDIIGGHVQAVAEISAGVGAELPLRPHAGRRVTEEGRSGEHIL